MTDKKTIYYYCIDCYEKIIPDSKAIKGEGSGEYRCYNCWNVNPEAIRQSLQEARQWARKMKQQRDAYATLLLRWIAFGSPIRLHTPTFEEWDQITKETQDLLSNISGAPNAPNIN